MITTNENLTMLCIHNGWFTRGDVSQYKKLIYANEHGYPLEDIATIIWVNTDNNWYREDIIHILTEEREKFDNTLKNSEED